MAGAFVAAAAVHTVREFGWLTDRQDDVFGAAAYVIGFVALLILIWKGIASRTLTLANELDLRDFWPLVRDSLPHVEDGIPGIRKDR